MLRSVTAAKKEILTTATIPNKEDSRVVNYMETSCSCGKKHTVALDDVVIGKGAINRLPEFINKYSANKPFILADRNTFAAAG